MKHDFKELKLDRVTRRFAGSGGHVFNALSDLTLTIRRGEFIALLGPSGCGKSTALNCIAGLLPLSGGTIHLDDERIDPLPPERRGFGMVFQNYALCPHMSVVKNIGFGLRLQGVPAAEIAPRVAKAMRLVQLSGQEHKLHAHAGMDKVYQVVEGEGVFLLEGRELPMTAGDLLVAPEGVPHGVRNTGTARLLVLLILAPAPLAKPLQSTP